jgi:FkbM family methyltransferase
VKAVIKQMLRAVGYDIVRAKAWRRTQGDILEHIIGLGFRPRTVIDVGVGNGTPWLYGHFREANLLLVEPLHEFELALEGIAREHRAQYTLAAAGATPGTTTINLRPDWMETSSAYASPVYDQPRYTSPRTVPMVTLDELCAQSNFAGPYLIKADAEGAELDVLDGARRILEETELVFLEVSFFELFAGAPQFYDVVRYMKKRGFVVYDIAAGHQRPLDGALVQTDVAFVKENGMFRRSNALGLA